ncbi:MAG: hypothetical protein IIU88_03045, partial [Clostridia bacterium]|nr:hypothetical protein [Clostridia bacterium]
VTPAFSFAHVGPKEKAWQKENGRGVVSRVATRDQGCAPWMGATWRWGFSPKRGAVHSHFVLCINALSLDA